MNCADGYFLNLGYCYPSNPSCLTYNKTDGSCTGCRNGSVLSSPLCIILSPTCATGSPGNCTSCTKGYILI